MRSGAKAVRATLVVVIVGSGLTVVGPAFAQGTDPDEPTTSTTSTTSSETEEIPGSSAPPLAAGDPDAREFRFEFGLGGGGHFFNADHGLGRSVGETQDWSPYHGGMYGARLTLNFNPWVALEGEGFMIPTRTRGFVQPPNGTSSIPSIFVFAYRGSLTFTLAPPGAQFRPIVTMGYGALSSIVSDVKKPESDTDGMFHAGLGFKLGNDRAGFRVDGRVLAPGACIAPQGLKIGDELTCGGPDYEVLGSFYVGFGEVVKPITKVIIKRETRIIKHAAPPPPEPAAPVDLDGDGLVGAADRCPNEAEDKDGFQDEDGCPEPDNDGDGILDGVDKCPLQPEDKDGFQDEDGCPDPDNDNDGILDGIDKCPLQPETRNGFKDDDGCPDEIPVEVKKFTGVIEGINFKSGSDQILPGSYGVLDRAVKVLADFADIRIEIQGHTDSVGKPEFNRDLSQRRAESVKQYFILRGINPGRLTAIGHGMDRPIGDNATADGRSRNRRTEFRLIMN